MIKTSLIKQCQSVSEILGTIKVLEIELCTDSRTYTPGQIFVALRGDKFDGFKFVPTLLKKTADIFVVNKENAEDALGLYNENKDLAFIIVSDTLFFLQELARLHALEWRKSNTQRKVIAISGSNGKTTHKEMLFHYLNGVRPGKIIKTEKNNNNHLGVPITLFQITNETEFAIVELGSNHPGEIKTLCDIALPDAGLVTNIGSTHLEFFGTEEKVFLEEGYLYWSIKDRTSGEGLFLQNTDDKFLRTLPKTNGTITYGQQGEANFVFSSDSVQINFKNNTYVLKNQSIFFGLFSVRIFSKSYRFVCSVLFIILIN